MRISLGFLPNGESAGYLVLVEDRDPDWEDEYGNKYYDCHYFPFTSVQTTATSPEVKTTYIHKKIEPGDTTSYGLALEKIEAPQVTVDVAYTNWGADPEDELFTNEYRADALESITVTDNRSGNEIASYRFFYHGVKEVLSGGVIGRHKADYIVIERTEGTDVRYASIYYQNPDVEYTDTPRVETGFEKMTLSPSPPASTPFPTSTTHEAFFTQFRNPARYQLYDPVETRYMTDPPLAVEIGHEWATPGSETNYYSDPNNERIGTALRSSADRWTITASDKEPLILHDNGEESFVFSPWGSGSYRLRSRIYADGEWDDRIDAGSVLSYTVNKYSGNRTTNNFWGTYNPSLPLDAFGYSQDTTEEYRIGRTPAYSRTVRGSEHFETAFQTRSKRTYFPGSSESVFRDLAIDYYAFEELLTGAWTSNTPLDPKRYFETPLQEVKETVTSGTNTWMVGKSQFTVPDIAQTGIYGQQLVVRERKDFRNATSFLTTKSKSFHPHCTETWLRDLPYSEEYPDGTKKVILYEKGTWNGISQTFTPGSGEDDKDLRITTLNGLSPGATSIAAWNGVSSLEPITLVPGKSTVEVTYRTKYGFTARMETRVFTDGASSTSSLPILNFQRMDYDRAGHLIRREDEKGQIYEASYTVGGARRGQKVWEKLEDGTEYHYVYDTLGRVRTKTRLTKSAGAYGELSAVATRFTYDEDNRVTEEATGPVSESFDSSNYDAEPAFAVGSDLLVRTFTYNGLGEIVARTEAGYPTTIDTPGLILDQDFVVQVGDSHGLATTETLPTDATKITTRNLDGSVSSVTGTAVVPTYYEYGLEDMGNGTFYESVTVFHGADGRLPSILVRAAGSTHRPGFFRYTKVVKDWLGNEVRTLRSSENLGSGSYESKTVFTYDDSNGRLQEKQTDSYAPNYFEYDAFGQLTLAGFDIDLSGELSIGPSGINADRINKTDTNIEYVSGKRWRVTRNYTFDNGDTSNPTLVSIERVQLSGLGASGGSLGKLVAYTEVEDPHGGKTRTETWVNRDTGLSTQRTFSPHYTDPSISTYLLGKLVKSETPKGITTTYEYDAHGRLHRVTDARFGITEYEYELQTHKLFKILRPDASNPSGGLIADRTFYYDDGGRLIREVNANGKSTRYAYNARDQLTHIWGDVPYPVKQTYYESGPRTGQLYQKITYREAAPSGGWSCYEPN